jgi:hypothetical protein
MKNIKKLGLLIGIIMLVASIGVVGAFTENPFWGGNAEDSVDPEEILVSRNPRQEVDPEEVKPLISQSQAFNIVEEMGYELTSETNVRLIEDIRVGTVYWEIGEGAADSPYLFAIGANDGRIIYMIPPIKVSEKWEYIVTSENAVEIAGEIMKDIRLVEIPEEIEHTAAIVEEDETYAIGKLYSVTWNQEFNGIPVVGSHLTIYLFPSGELFGLANCWQELDVDTDYSVTANEAIKAAQMIASSDDFPDGLRARIDGANEIQTELSIERPIRYLDWSKPILGEYELIWAVSFIDSEGGTIRIQISAHSNEYVGMDATR